MMSMYLRAMGSKVGRDVWCDTNTVTETTWCTIGDGRGSTGRQGADALVPRPGAAHRPDKSRPRFHPRPDSAILPDARSAPARVVRPLGRDAGRGAARRYPLARRTGRDQVMVTWLDIDTDGAPQVALIDATLEGLDEAGLRTRARDLGTAVGAGAVSRYLLPPLRPGSAGTPGRSASTSSASSPAPGEFGLFDLHFRPSGTARRWTTDDEIVSLWVEQGGAGQGARRRAGTTTPAGSSRRRGGLTASAARGGRPPCVFRTAIAVRCWRARSERDSPLD